jgi:long-chain acyl-CoA synthetase
VFIDFIVDRFTQFHDRDAVVWRDTVFTYDHLLAELRAWRDVLAARIGRGKVVAVRGDFSPTAVALVLALIENEEVFVPLSSARTDIEEKLAIAEVEYVVELDGPGHRVVATGATNTHPLIERLRRNRRPGVIIFSSGTTGAPKAAAHDFAPLMNKFKVPRQAFRTVNFLVFDHWGGINTLLHTLANGGVVGVPAERTPDRICGFIARYGMELLPTTPTFMNMLLVSRAYEHHDLSSLRVVTYGTEPMPEATLKAFHRALPHVELKQTYGLTELGVLRTKSKSSDSVWLKVGGEDYETKVVDGVLWIRARTSILGYLNAPSPFDSDGWYNTGDRVIQDGEWLRFLGRDTEIINVGGAKVYPGDVESALLQMDEITDCFVYGRSSALTGEIVAADVVVRDGIDHTTVKAAIVRACRERLERYQMPVVVNVVAGIGVSEAFKKQRRKRAAEPPAVDGR